MPKTHNTRKQSKKQPMMTPKEKRAAKIARKRHDDTPATLLPH